MQVTSTYNMTSITCQYKIPENLRDPASHEKLVQFFELAVADTVNQHPLLQVGLIGERTKKPTWIQLDQLDFSQHIEWEIVTDMTTFDKKLEDLTLQKLDNRITDYSVRPGWRIVVLKLEELGILEAMFVWNHIQADGTGARIFHQTLLGSLNSLANGPELPPLENHIWKTTVSVKTMLPPQEVLAKYRITPGFAASTIWKELKPPMFVSKSAFVSWAAVTQKPNKTGIRSLTVNDDTVRKLLAACRTHKTTVTGLMHGIAFVSLASQVEDDKVASMMGETPLSLRRFIKPKSPKYPDLVDPEKLIGNYVSKMDHEVDKSVVQKVRELSKNAAEGEKFAALEEQMWAVSVQIRGEIQAKLDLGLKNDVVGLMGVVTDWEKYHYDEMKKPRVVSWLVTNVGAIDGQPTTEGPSSWSIERSKFSLSANVISPVFDVAVISTKGKDMFIDITWQDGIVDDKIADQLTEDFKGWLDFIASKV